MADYFKNTELADRYHISESTVRNWIKIAQNGKLNLELVELSHRSYVANNISNIPIIESLVEKNRKYRNTLAAKTVTPSEELLGIFNEAQIYDIARSLELHHEIPLQYQYFSSGAQQWDEAIKRQVGVHSPSMVKGTIETLGANFGYLDKRLAGFASVNVIDVGVGNGEPVKELLANLIEQGKLNRYIALDFSDDMLAIAKRELLSKFGDNFPFESYNFDVTHERFANIIAEEYLESNQNSINLILLLGATPNNFRKPYDAFRSIAESMNPNDLFIYTDKMEPRGALPEWLENSANDKSRKPEFLRSHRLVLDRLNIKDSFYDVEVGFDKSTQQRYSRARLRFALTIKFQFDRGGRTIHFEKGDAITIWRCWQTTQPGLMDMLESAGLYICHSSQSEDRNYILTISEVGPHPD